jgi:hypothetical protein
MGGRGQSRGVDQRRRIRRTAPIGILPAVLAASLVAGSALAGGTPFRCGSRIIDTGMTRAEVRAACGAPTSQRTDFQDVHSANNRVLGATEVDHWVYDSYSATRLLVFVDDRLQSIGRW